MPPPVLNLSTLRRGDKLLGQRVGFVMTVREGYEEEYQRRHRQVYPDLLDAFSRLGIHNYSIYIHGRTLFATMTVDGDYDKAMSELDRDPANMKWQSFMKELMEPWTDQSIAHIIPEVFFHP